VVYHVGIVSREPDRDSVRKLRETSIEVALPILQVGAMLPQPCRPTRKKKQLLAATVAGVVLTKDHSVVRMGPRQWNYHRGQRMGQRSRQIGSLRKHWVAAELLGVKQCLVLQLLLHVGPSIDQ